MPTLSGTVKNSAGIGIARTVRAYLRTSGALQSSGTSDGLGDFSLTVPLTAPYFVVAHDMVLDGNTSLLMHMDGANGGALFPEDTGKTISVAGNANTSTTLPKLGTASAYFDGTGDYLYPAASADFAMGTGDFCAECFVKLEANRTHSVLCVGDISSATGWKIQFDSAQRPYFRNGGSDRITGSSTISTSVWAHVALERVAGVFTLYLNGASVGTYTGALTLSDNNLFIGTEYAFADGTATNHLSGYLDEVRITKGAYRYNGAFTPTTSQFSILTEYGENAMVFDNVTPV